MEKNNLKKLFLDKDLNPVIQKEKNGAIILYSSNDGVPKYELTYHYICGKLVLITQKDLTGKNNRKYSLISLFFKKVESLFIYDKFDYFDYNKDDEILLELYNRALIY